MDATHNTPETNMTTTNLTKIQAATLAALLEITPASTEELADALGISESAARGRARRLEALGLVECEETEGTYNNGSRALRHLDWHADGDDDDVRTALGLALLDEDGNEIATAADALDAALAELPADEDDAPGGVREGEAAAAAVTIQEVSKAMAVVNDFSRIGGSWYDRPDVVRVVELAVARGWAFRVSVTQAGWTDAGCELAEAAAAEGLDAAAKAAKDDAFRALVAAEQAERAAELALTDAKEKTSEAYRAFRTAAEATDAALAAHCASPVSELAPNT